MFLLSINKRIYVFISYNLELCLCESEHLTSLIKYTICRVKEKPKAQTNFRKFIQIFCVGYGM